MKTSHFLTFVGGAIAGAAIALLFAPAKGEETRRRIKDMIDSEVDKIREKCICKEGECTCSAEE